MEKLFNVLVEQEETVDLGKVDNSNFKSDYERELYYINKYLNNGYFREIELRDRFESFCFKCGSYTDEVSAILKTPSCCGEAVALKAGFENGQVMIFDYINNDRFDMAVIDIDLKTLEVVLIAYVEYERDEMKTFLRRENHNFTQTKSKDGIHAPKRVAGPSYTYTIECIMPSNIILGVEECKESEAFLAHGGSALVNGGYLRYHHTIKGKEYDSMVPLNILHLFTSEIYDPNFIVANILGSAGLSYSFDTTIENGSPVLYWVEDLLGKDVLDDLSLYDGDYEALCSIFKPEHGRRFVTHYTGLNDEFLDTFKRYDLLNLIGLAKIYRFDNDINVDDLVRWMLLFFEDKSHYRRLDPKALKEYVTNPYYPLFKSVGHPRKSLIRETLGYLNTMDDIMFESVESLQDLFTYLEDRYEKEGLTFKRAYELWLSYVEKAGLVSNHDLDLYPVHLISSYYLVEQRELKEKEKMVDLAIKKSAKRFEGFSKTFSDFEILPVESYDDLVLNCGYAPRRKLITDYDVNDKDEIKDLSDLYDKVVVKKDSGFHIFKVVVRSENATIITLFFKEKDSNFHYLEEESNIYIGEKGISYDSSYSMFNCKDEIKGLENDLLNFVRKSNY